MVLNHNTKASILAHQELLASINEPFAVVCIAGSPNSNALVTQAFSSKWSSFTSSFGLSKRLSMSDKLISWRDPQTQTTRKILLINYQCTTQGLEEDGYDFFAYLCMISSLMIFTSDSVSEQFGDQSWSELASLAAHLKKYSIQEQNERNWLHNSPQFLYVATNHNSSRTIQGDEKFWKTTKSNRALQFISKFKELFSVTFDKNSFLSLPREPSAIISKINDFFANSFSEILEDLVLTKVLVYDRSLHSVSIPVVGMFDKICEMLLQAVCSNDLSNDFVGPVVKVATVAKVISTKEKLISQLWTEIQSCETSSNLGPELEKKKDNLIETITEECEVYDIDPSVIITKEQLDYELEARKRSKRPTKSRSHQSPRQIRPWDYKNQLTITWKNLPNRTYTSASIQALEPAVKELFFSRKGFETLVSVEKVMFINNPGLQANFEHRLKIMTNTQKYYPTKFKVKQNSMKAHMQTLLSEKLVEDHDGAKIQVAKGWVGIAPHQVEDLCEKGFSGIELNDQGYFGKGHYTTPQAIYACHYADGTIQKKTIEPLDGCYTVVLCWVALGQVYPVCRDVDYTTPYHYSHFYKHQTGSQALKEGFDSHHACVSSRLNYQAVTDFDGTGMSRGMVEEFVCRESAQVLPYCVVYFKKKPSCHVQ